MITNDAIKNAKKIIIKVGTSTLTHDTGRINLRHIDHLARAICDLRHDGKNVILVSSGAIGVGMGKLELKKRPDCVMEKQAAAAVGQIELMGIYGHLFSEYGCSVAQILLTKNVIEDEVRKQNTINTFEMLAKWGVVPIVNENDTISTEEIEFGDNDTLSAMVAELTDADLLIILSDIDGLYDKDPKINKDAKLISVVKEVTDEHIKNAGGAGTSRGTGGMITKLSAAKRVNKHGIHMIIANGKEPDIIYDILEGKQVGTLFLGAEK